MLLGFGSHCQAAGLGRRYCHVEHLGRRVLRIELA